MMQLQLEVQGQSKVLRVSSCLDQSCSGVCDQLKHFMIEVGSYEITLLIDIKGAIACLYLGMTKHDRGVGLADAWPH